MARLGEKMINKIKRSAEGFFVGASGCHDWSHVERVYNTARAIARKEKADVNVVRAAAYLHDIGRREEMKSKGKFCHAEKGAEMAVKILNKLDLDQKTVENIRHCILTHRFRKNNKPESAEAKIIFDADKLDSIGAIGVARDFYFAGFIGSRLYTGNEEYLAKQTGKHDYSKEDTALLEYYFKLKKIRSRMLTRTGKKIAAARHNYMVAFFKRFSKETNGAI
jgi:uncharacterized domain HDIG